MFFFSSSSLPANDISSFIDFESVLGTLLHELVHIAYGPHDAQFYKLLDELQNECESDMAKASALSVSVVFPHSGYFGKRARLRLDWLQTGWLPA